MKKICLLYIFNSIRLTHILFSHNNIILNLLLLFAGVYQQHLDRNVQEGLS